MSDIMEKTKEKVKEKATSAVKGIVGAAEGVLDTVAEKRKTGYESLVPEAIEMPERAKVVRREYENISMTSNMGKIVQTEESALDQQIHKIENVAFKHHLYQVNKNYYPEFTVDEKEKKKIKTISYEQKIRGTIVRKFVFDKNEIQIDKMNNIFASMADLGSTIAMVIHRTVQECTLAFLIKSDAEIGSENESIANNTLKTLKSSLKGNFPGTQLQEFIGITTQPEIYAAIPEINSEPSENIRDCRGFLSYYKRFYKSMEKDTYYSVADFIDEIFNPEQAKAVAVVTGVPSVKSEDSKYINQGIEKLLDGACPVNDKENYTLILLAEPLRPDIVASIRNGYEQMASMMTPFHTFQYNITDTFGYSKTLSETENITNQVGAATNYSVGVGAHASANASANANANLNNGKNSSIADAHTDGTHKDKSDSFGGSVSNTTGGSVTAGVPGASASAHNDTTVSADYHHTNTKGENHSDTHTISNGFSKGYTVGGNAGAGASVGINANVGMSETINTGRSYTGGFSFGETTNDSRSESQTRTFTSISIENIIERLKLEINRFNASESSGMWRFAGYVLSGDLAMAERVAHMYQGLIQGEESSVERTSVNTWTMGYVGDKARTSDYNAIITSLLNLDHPTFKLKNDNTAYPRNIYCSTEINGTELALAMNMPQKSLVGLPVISCASFGRNISKISLLPENDSEEIHLGSLYHMMEESHNNPVTITKQNLTSHTFITGSTGSGKSNTVYTMLERLAQKDVHFLVVEPAKGEYRDIFGGYEDVQVFGANPYRSKLLRINPFSFPSDIHVLEHIDRLIEIFNVCWPMYAAMPAVLKEAIERAYESAGWNLTTSRCKHVINGKNTYPNFVDVLNQVNIVIKDSKYSADSKGDYIGALSMRISSLTNGINGLILTNNELSYEELFDNNVIVDLSRVGSVETKSLIMGMLVLKLQEYRMNQGISADAQLKHVTVLEEAHNLLKRTSTEQSSEGSNLLGKSVEMLANAIAEMRTYGEGFIIADQSPGLLDMSVIRNTNTKIIMRLPDLSDRELVGKAAGLNDDQIVELGKLETGVASVTQSGWLEPVLCHVDAWDKKKNKPCQNEYEEISDSTEIKKQIVKLVLKPPHSIETVNIEDIFAQIDRTHLSTELKIKLLALVSEKDVNRFRNLRKGIIYEIFAPDTILEKNICFRNEIREWCSAMQDALVPQLNNFEEDEIQKILTLLAYEKSRIESKREYDELINNLLVFMDKERGKM